MDYIQLTEVKKGHTGTGLLIEHDGHINSDSETILQIKEDIGNHNKFVIPEHFVVSAVFQKYNIKNANGRIYPENILKREVEKYKANIKNHNAVGSLDHPSCQLADTQILTEYGWKQITDVSEGENILTLTANKKIETHPIIRKIEEKYSGRLIRLKGRLIDIKVTPNHKFPIFDRYKNFKGLYTAEDILKHNIPDQNHCSLIKIGEWHNNSDESFVIGRLSDDELAHIQQNSLKDKYSKNVTVNMETWAKFMGIYLSEGCVSKDRVSIYQKKEAVCAAIEEMMDDMPFEYRKTNNGTCNVYSIYDMRLSKYLSQFGDCYEKYVPYSLKKQGRDILKTFYDWFVLGDGRKRGDKDCECCSDDVFSVSRQLVMDLNEIQLKIGYCGSFHEEDRKHDRTIGERTIKGDNCHNMYFSFRSLGKYISLNDKYMEVSEEDYSGSVYCVEVENHTFYTMCSNGKCLWSGNSSSISGHDIAHNILRLEWQGSTLVGDMELHISPGYIKYGVCSTSGDLVANMLLSGYLVGVSSRGVGSVEQKLGDYVVGDDFELICWDVVIEPSTPGAYIGSTRDDIQPYIESDNTNITKNPLLEKINDINNILKL